MDPVLLASFAKVIAAALLGACIGAERTISGKDAGMRTFALVSMGSCIFIVIALLVNAQFVGVVNFDPMRVAAGVITGVGFIGAGMIFSKDDALHGLTSAAGLWAAAGVGMALGYGLFIFAIFCTILTLFVFTGLWFIEEKIRIAVAPFVEKNPNTRVQQVTHTPVGVQSVSQQQSQSSAQPAISQTKKNLPPQKQ
jgi:putative Mg2+ transporter-C (MgtC) family protein